MGARMIDRNGHRWGASASAVALLVAFVVQPAADLVVPVLALVLAVSSTFGLRYSALGVIYRATKKALHLSIPVELEDEAPPRFAQLIGALFLGAASVGLYVVESVALGWTLGLIVAGLQALLGFTGICVGCEMYLYGKKLTAARSAS